MDSTLSQDEEFEQFAVARARQLHRSAWLLCGDVHHAEDLVQETLAKVYVRMTRRFGAEVDNLAAYAQTTLVRTFISASRRRSSTERATDGLPERLVMGDDIDLQLALSSALGQLQPLDRAVLVMRFLDDQPVAEVARQLGIREGAVRTRTSRALERLRSVLGTSMTDLLGT